MNCFSLQQFLLYFCKSQYTIWSIDYGFLLPGTGYIYFKIKVKKENNYLEKFLSELLQLLQFSQTLLLSISWTRVSSLRNNHHIKTLALQCRNNWATLCFLLLLFTRTVATAIIIIQFSSVQFSLLVMSNSLRPHKPQHTRPPCPSLTPESTQTHVHWISDAIQSSHPLSSPSPPAPNPSQHQGLFTWISSSALSFLYSPTLTSSKHDYWKTHSFD